MRKTEVKRYSKKDFEKFMNTQNTTSNKTTQHTNHTSDYKVEKNIPIPHHRIHRYPLLDLKVGDSFVVPINETKHVRSAIGRVHRNNIALSFVTRTVNGRGKAGKQLRVWRVTS